MKRLIVTPTGGSPTARPLAFFVMGPEHLAEFNWIWWNWKWSVRLLKPGGWRHTLLLCLLPLFLLLLLLYYLIGLVSAVIWLSSSGLATIISQGRADKTITTYELRLANYDLRSETRKIRRRAAQFYTHTRPPLGVGVCEWKTGPPFCLSFVFRLVSRNS